MKMKAFNRQSGEVRKCNTDDLKGEYYTLDIRLWDFEKDEDEESEEGEEPA